MELDIQKVVNSAVEKLESWINTFIDLLPNIVLALLIMIAAFFVARIIANLSSKYIVKFGGDKTIASFLQRVIFIAVFILGGVLALSVMNLDKTISSVLAGLGIVGLALGFAFQDTAANVMSGIYISLRQPFKIGDIVETTTGHMGNVSDISLRVTKIRLFNGQHLHIPNKMLFQEPFLNYTEEGKRRLQLSIGVSYGEDLEKVQQVAIQAVKDNVSSRLENEEITVFWKEFGSSSINFDLNVWMKYDINHKNYIDARNQTLKAVKKAFDQNGITIPFPIRTLDFGIKGGKQLSKDLTSVNWKEELNLNGNNQ